MPAETWAAVDRYLAELLIGPDPSLDAVRAASDAAGLPSIHVPAMEGKLLMLLAQIVGARRILEIGTLGGYSTIWLARGVAPGGRVVTLELDEGRARVARENFARAGMSAVIELRVGPASDALDGLVAEGAGPFDLMFLDADRPHYAELFRSMLRLCRPGTLIVADNVVRAGAVADPDTSDAGAQGVRRFLEAIAQEPRVTAIALQTVSGKGHDGVALLRVERA
ncbi:MAG: O-methyltransferase [Acidobacteria bacterium]|nr:O-methyltransferase [Acidobacteriota bacterium]